MADISGTRTHRPTSDTTLCEQCQTYDLQQWFYPRDGHILSQRAPDAGAHFEPASLAKRDLERCSFCRFLLDSMDLSPELKAIKGKTELSSMWLAVQKVGTVVWQPPSLDEDDHHQPNGPGWHRADSSLARNVQYLRISPLEWSATAPVHIYPACNADGTSNSDQVLHRRITHSRLDMSLLASWLRNCEELHGSNCIVPLWQRLPLAATRMIDVAARCIVDIATPAEYFALSYCWGTSQRSLTSLRLTKANLEDLQKCGALTDDKDDLPSTIRDAMLLTRQLGQRYLWVDALCICQDDADDKLTQINQMDSIYKYASLTLVAAAGSDSWSGLPGLRGRTQHAHISRNINGMNLSARHSRPDFDVAIANSSWATRAWTLQEHILSSRLLLFTAEEVTWECGRAIWTEDLFLENLSPHLKVDLVRNKDFASKPAAGLSPLQRYRYLIFAVSQRNLTHEADRLYCMQGMLNVLEKDLPGGFFWGLPVAVLDSSLLFASGQGPEAPLLRVKHFPTWSWAGWKENPQYTITSPYDVGFSDRPRNDMDILGLLDHKDTRDAAWIRKEVAWYCLDDTGEEWRSLATELISEDGSFFYQASNSKWHESDPDQLLQLTKARFGDAEVPLNHALACWTQSVYLRVDRIKSKRDEPRGFGTSKSHKDLYTVRDANGLNICYLALTEAYRASQPDELYFILIAHHRRFEKQYGPIMEVMHVETKAGITYRVQGVRDCVINIEMWKRFSPKWEFFVIG